MHEQFGLYETKYKCSADYDFFYKLIIKNKKKDGITKKNELISTFDLGAILVDLVYLSTC